MHLTTTAIILTFVSRFVTGLLDTQTDLSRLSLPSQTAPSIPLSLRETRHRIVHRRLPTLAELKRAAQESLAWLWEHYWSHMDALVTAPTWNHHAVSPRDLQERLQGLLRNYIKERKAEIKAKSKDAMAAERAVGSYLTIDAVRDVKLGALLGLLVEGKHVLPAGKKFGASMEGAYLIWTPFFLAFTRVDRSFAHALTRRMVYVLGALSKDSKHEEEDSEKEGMYNWVLRLENSGEWRETRKRDSTLQNDVLSICFTMPTFWTLKLADSILRIQKDASVHDVAAWSIILDAAKNECDDRGNDQPVPSEPLYARDGMVKKSRGPQKYTGLWRSQPFGSIVREKEDI